MVKAFFCRMGILARLNAVGQECPTYISGFENALFAQAVRLTAKVLSGRKDLLEEWSATTSLGLTRFGY